MVILGGLELVAAGVILHKLSKDKEREHEREQEQRSRERRHERRHHHRDSPPYHARKENRPYPTQGPGPRAHSAPPPRYTPNWQLQPAYYPPQTWQPRQDEKSHVWQAQPNNYPPTWQPQPQSQPQPQTPPQPNMYPLPHHDDTALSELLRGGQANDGNQRGARAQRRPTAVAPPDPNYAELSGDSPRTYDNRPSASPHVSFALPRDNLQGDYRNDPPPAYQDNRPE